MSDMIQFELWECITIIRIQYNIATCLVAVALLATTTAYASESADVFKQRIGSGNPVEGKSKSSLCQSCHGEEGLSLEDVIPNLAGQYSQYIVNELRNFQSGARKNPIMGTMAKTINDEDLADIAAYFASLEKMQGGGWGNNPVAKKLFLKGDLARNIGPCSNCHGVNGKGKVSSIATFPMIGGQHKAYLRVQLINWRKGTGANRPSGVMNKIAKPLTDAEIEALTDYISGL
jgi:cytochrome c553